MTQQIQSGASLRPVPHACAHVNGQRRSGQFRVGLRLGRRG